MSAQKPMSFRMQEALELIWSRGQIRASLIDKKVLKRLIKQGKAKIISVGGYRVGHGRISRTMVIAINPLPPKEEEPDTGGPYAKRRADLEESGLPYKGKNWGKARIDLPREERERKISEKKLMWKKLKDWRTQ